MKKNGQKKNGAGAAGIPWYIRSTDKVDLVYKYDPAIKRFPKQDTDVAPLNLCTVRANQTPAIFRARPLQNREHLGLASISIKGLQENQLHEQYLAAAFEIAQMCIVEILNPDGSKWDSERWKEEIESAHPGLVVGLGLWILGESAWDPTQSKKPRPQPQISVN